MGLKENPQLGDVNISNDQNPSLSVGDELQIGCAANIKLEVFTCQRFFLYVFQ